MRGFLLDGLVAVGWLASVGLVLLHERGQLWGGLPSPTATLAATLEAKEQWFGLYYQGHRIGFSQTLLMPEERDGIPGVGVVDKGRLSFNLLGTPQELEVGAQAFIDADWRLQEFTAFVRSPTYQLTWSGRRRGDTLIVTVTTPTSSMTKQLKDPTGGAFVNGLSSWAAFHRLQVGQSGKAWVLNPLALSPEAVYFYVRGMEPVNGKEALVVETDVSGMTTTTWVTPDGEVLKESSPLGWELRQEPREQALARIRATAPTLDLLTAASVPADQTLEDPARIGRLILLIEGMEGGEFAVQRPWQQVLPAERLSDYRRGAPEGPWCLVQLDRPHRVASEATAPADTLKRYQRPSLFVQSDDPRILAKASEIIGLRTDPWERVIALQEWVHRTLAKQFTVGLPSALDVLATPAGDCHEHTIFFTALARSAQVPTRMVAGLVYQQGRFYYHAWPEVWLGEWIPTDPTLGQPLADVTHLGLSEAENEQLLALGQYVGKLRLSVLAHD